MAEPFAVEVHSGRALAWSVDWPGLSTGAPSVEALRAAFPVALAEYGAWLAGHGFEDGPGGAAEITEILDMRAAPPGQERCFVSDVRSASLLDLRRWSAFAAWAAADLAAAAVVPPELLDWQPPEVRVEHADPWAPDLRTIRGIVAHALQLEVYYRQGIQDGPACGIFEPVSTVAEELQRTLAVLRNLRSEDFRRVFRPVRPSRTEPDEWTAFKVLRRLIAHHRAHTAEIIQRRTWVLLGVPSALS